MSTKMSKTLVGLACIGMSVTSAAPSMALEPTCEQEASIYCSRNWQMDYSSYQECMEFEVTLFCNEPTIPPGSYGSGCWDAIRNVPLPSYYC